MNEQNNNNQKKTGRRPKADPAKIRYTISFNEVEHSRFLELFDQSGMTVKAHFITSCIFEKTIPLHFPSGLCNGKYVDLFCHHKTLRL